MVCVWDGGTQLFFLVGSLGSSLGESVIGHALGGEGLICVNSGLVTKVKDICCGGQGEGGRCEMSETRCFCSTRWC